MEPTFRFSLDLFANIWLGARPPVSAAVATMTFLPPKVHFTFTLVIHFSVPFIWRNINTNFRCGISLSLLPLLLLLLLPLFIRPLFCFSAIQCFFLSTAVSIHWLYCDYYRTQVKTNEGREENSNSQKVMFFFCSISRILKPGNNNIQKTSRP